MIGCEHADAQRPPQGNRQADGTPPGALPVEGATVFAADRTTRASITESFLAFGLALRPSVIAGLLLEAPQAEPGRTAGPASS
jgi:hypothetical protein